jgi:hypothetical protein
LVRVRISGFGLLSDLGLRISDLPWALLLTHTHQFAFRLLIIQPLPMPQH